MNPILCIGAVLAVAMLIGLVVDISRVVGRRYFPCRSRGTLCHTGLVDHGSGIRCSDCGATWHEELHSSIAGNGDPLRVYKRD